MPILDNFVTKYVPKTVKILKIFCDSCAGQNKNYTIFRYLVSLASQNKFETIVVTFPIRGHFYLECDKNFALVNQKTMIETADEWL